MSPDLVATGCIKTDRAIDLVTVMTPLLILGLFLAIGVKLISQRFSLCLTRTPVNKNSGREELVDIDS